MSIKYKLLQKYFTESYVSESARLTPLRRFLYTIGFDYKDLTQAQIDKWARTKRYKNFMKMRKIKRMADEANVKEDIIYENIDIFSHMNIDPMEDILDEESKEFNDLVEYAIQRYVTHRRQTTGIRRGRYKTAQQRQQMIKRRILSTVNTGGTVSTGESDIQFKTGKKQKLASGRGKIILRRRLPNRPLAYKRQTVRTY